MIVPMKRVHVVLQDLHFKDCLTWLQKLGVVHVDVRPAESQDTRNLTNAISDLEEILGRLRTLMPRRESPAVSGSYRLTQVEEVTAVLKEVIQRDKKCREELRQLEERLLFWEPWGGFEPASLRELEEQGIKISLYRLNRSQYEALADSGAEYYSIAERAGFYFAAVVDYKGSGSVSGEEGDAPVLPPELSPPKQSLAEMEARIGVLKGMIGNTEKELRTRLYEYDHLYAYWEDLRDALCFEEVSLNAESVGDTLSVISGFAPAEKINDLKLLARNHSFGLIVRDIAEEDAPPTLLKQNFISRLINPVLSFLDITPAYHEPDISLSFFSFFLVFVAMIMGDAAYGIAILLLGISIHIVQKQASTLVRMLYMLGTGTFLWGAASGSWFGSEALASLDVFRNWTVWQLAVYPEFFGHTVKEQQNSVMWFCFTLGGAHLILARLWRFARERREGSLKYVSHLGSVLVIYGLYQILLSMVGITDVLPEKTMLCLEIGLGLIIVFGQQERGKNFFSGIWGGITGLFSTFLDTVGVFGDIMSYIRLFAVGIASFSIASSFNGMGVGIFEGKEGSLSFLFLLFGILVIVIGHLVNFVLGCLSVIVHGVRLNMLEFSNHIGLEWSGHKYRPFKKQRSR